jgi:hypothetical protein
LTSLAILQRNALVSQYLKRIDLKRLNRFSYSNGRVKTKYENIVVELGPLDLLEEKILLDGRHYTLPMRTSPRSQIVALKEILETHEKSKSSPLNSIRRLFSNIGSYLVSDSVADNIDISQEPSVRLDELVGALLLTMNYVNLHRYSDDNRLKENLRQLAEAIENRKKRCQSDLNNFTLQNNAHSSPNRPTNNPLFLFSTTYPLIDYLRDMTERQDNLALDQMKAALESHLRLRYREIDQDQFCRTTFNRYYTQSQDEQLRNTCQNLEELRTCSIEFIAQNRIYDENMNIYRESRGSASARAPAESAARGR